MLNVWQMGEEGVVFENSFTCQPVCGPVRACLQTGTYATENRCCWNGIPLPEGTKTLADYFNENGYVFDEKGNRIDFTGYRTT